MLDEALPQKLATLLRAVGCPAEPFPSEWKGVSDGVLLDAIGSNGEAVLLTCDRNMPFQQTIALRPIALVVVPEQRLRLLIPLVDAIAHAALQAKAGTVTILDRSGEPRPIPD